MIAENHPQNPIFIQRMFGKIASRYDLANHILSLGLDFGWRKQIAHKAAALQPGIILDLATGSGDLALALKKWNPRAEIYAADFCLPMLAEAQKKDVNNLVGADGMSLPFADDTFDILTVAFGLRNMRSYEEAVTEFLRVIRPKGTLFILDFSVPENWMRRPYLIYLRYFLPNFAGLLTGEKLAYRYLGDSIEAFPSGEKMLNLISGCGGNHPSITPQAGGIVSLYTVSKP